MEKKTIGAFICVLRKASGMTQRQLAEKLNVSDKAVSRWERDETLPDLTLIPVLAEIFGVTSDELLRGCRNSRETPPPQAEKKSKKQLQYLLDKTRTDYKIRTLICVLIAAVGVIAAAILNLAFLRAIAGFWVGCIFFLGAAVLQLIFKIQCDARLQAEEFDQKALADCKAAIGTYNYWGFAAIAILFAFTLPLAFVPDSYWGLSLDVWVGWDNAFFTRQPGLWVGLAAGLIWFFRQKRQGKIQITPKQRLLIKTVAILLLVMAVTILGITVLDEFMEWNRHWTGQTTTHQDVQSFLDYIQLPLDVHGHYYKYEVIEQDAQGNPLVVRYYDEDTFSYRGTRADEMEWQGEPLRYVRLNRTVCYWDFSHNDAIYTYTYAQRDASDRILACIVHPFLLLLPAQIAVAVLIYKKKAKKLS